MFKRISVTEAVALIEKQEILVVDVRDPNTFAQGYIKGATHIDNNNFQQFIATADKSKPLLAVCYHGNSSQQAADIFSQQGFSETYSMDGGMCEWVLTQPVVSAS